MMRGEQGFEDFPLEQVGILELIDQCCAVFLLHRVHQGLALRSPEGIGDICDDLCVRAQPFGSGALARKCDHFLCDTVTPHATERGVLEEFCLLVEGFDIEASGWALMSCWRI